MKLYEISGEYRTLLTRLETVDEDGVVLTDADVAEALGEVQVDLEEKIQSCARMVRNLEAEADMLKTESRRLAERSARRQANADKLRVYMAHHMAQTELTHVKGVLDVRLAAPRDSVEVTDVDVLPLEYCQRKVVPDKTAIRNAIKAGQAVPGAALVQGPPSVRIK